jgi:capsular polysaccharide biosynthesis protein
MKLIKVDSPQVKVDSPQGATRSIRVSKLANFYREKLKHIRLIRIVVRRVWGVSLGLYLNVENAYKCYLLGHTHRRRRPLSKQKDSVEQNGIFSHKLYDFEPIPLAQPVVYPVKYKKYLDSVGDHLVFPELSIKVLQEATCYGGTNMVLVGAEVIHHDLYDCKSDLTSEELHCKVKVFPKKNQIRWLMEDQDPIRLSRAAVFVDACAENYAHWLTEVLPRIMLFCLEDSYKAVPLIVNDGLHENIMSSLELVVDVGREVLVLPAGRAVLADELFVTSVVGYVPFDRRKNKFMEFSQGVFSAYALSLLRETISGSGFCAEKGAASPEKIFLKRNSGLRKVVNTIEVEKILVGKGFVVVEPEKLSFIQQVKLFSHAKQVIAPTGAALANAIFCKPGVKVAVLMAKNKDMIYRYWVNMLSPLKLKVFYVLGEMHQNLDLGIHGDFYIEAHDVLNLLNAMEEE